jgi:hypothetical protein
MNQQAFIDGFDADEIAAVMASLRQQPQTEKLARAVALRHRIETRRAKSEVHLAEILPAVIDDGCSYHVISHGDVDALSYLAHALCAVTFDRVILSTWCMAQADVDQLSAWLDESLIGRLDLYVGEIFPSQYGDEYIAARRLIDAFGGRIVVARNHSKVIAACNDETGYALVCESSANVNTNPRIEQTTLTASRALFDFYAEFFSGLETLDRARS